MLRRLIIVTIIDIVVITIWDYWANSIDVRQEEAIGVIFIVPVIIIVSGMIGFVLRYQKNIWGQAMLINMFIAFAIFFVVFKYEGWKQEHDNYSTFYFTEKETVYKIVLRLKKAELQDGLRYSVYETLGEYGNRGTDLDGSYITRNDTIIMTSDKGKVMKIFGKALFDYAQEDAEITLRRKPE